MCSYFFLMVFGGCRGLCHWVAMNMATEASVHKRRNLDSSILFIQQEHATTLKALHEEIQRLQQRCTGMVYNYMYGTSTNRCTGRVQTDTVPVGCKQTHQ